MRLAVMLVLGLSCLANAQVEEGTYALGAYDEISVAVARHEEYAGRFVVPESGSINFPLLGELNVLGKSISEVQRELTERASERLNNPSVYVTLVAARPKRVSVIGLVETPGVLNLLPGWRVSEAIAAAGGLTVPAEQAVCRLFRVGAEDVALDLAEVLREGADDANMLLREGDTISVMAKKTLRVYVTGAVKTPGLVEIDEGMTTVQALARAGGHLENASLSRAYITRGGGEKYQVNLYKVLVEGDVDKDVALQQNDVLTIPPIASKVAVFGEVGSPGWYPLPEERESRLSDALAQAGGVLKSGINSNIAILRASDPTAPKRVVDFHRYLKTGDETANPIVQDGDIVVVSANRRSDWDKVLNAVLTLSLVRLFSQ
ncbi:MAG: SLBB domain-containing protein [Fimbriimonadia bacterium]|jgi:polysaccharide export outer membrane protein